MKRNITVQLDEKIVQKARVVAARRSMSISGLISKEIEKTAANDTYWVQSKKKAFAQLDKPFHLSGEKLPSRDSLHQR